MFNSTRSISLLAFFCLFLSGRANAATATLVSLFPESGAVNVCPDTHLRMTFERWVVISTSGALTIRLADTGAVVWQLQLTSLPWPPTPWPAAYKTTVAGKTLNYYPAMASGTYAQIIPPNGILQYDTEYYVTVTAGFITSAGNPSPLIDDAHTWRFRTRPSPPPVINDYVVAADGTGDFCTIQAAIDAVPGNSPNRTVIRVKNGVYRELLNVPSNKKKITLLGQDRDRTIVAVINNDTLNGGSSNRCTFEISGDDFRIYNMTFRNLTPQGGSQAETIKLNNARRCVASNCELYSFQDTLLISGSMYLTDCYIEGDVDYVWGYGTAFFESCHLRTMRSGSYINMARNNSSTLGYFYVDCTLSAPAGVTNNVFARIDQGAFPYSQVAFINTTMPAGLISSAGWHIYGTGSTADIKFWEYKSVDPAGNSINVSGRHAASRQLSDAEALHWSDPFNVFNWNPIADPPTTAWLFEPLDGSVEVIEATPLHWTPGAGATLSLVYFGTDNPPQFLMETTDSSFIPETEPGTTYYWSIDQKNDAGVTVGEVLSFTTRSWFCGETYSSGLAQGMPLSDAFHASDLNGDCVIDIRDFAILASEWLSQCNPAEYLINGDFELPILSNGWQFIPGGAPVTLTRLIDGGNPGTAAMLSKPNTAAVYGDSRFYQVLPVTPGKRYQLTGQWKGDLSGYDDRPQWSGGASSMPRNVIVVYVGFSPSAIPETWGNYYFRKYYGFFFDGTKNIGDDGVWDWEPISDSGVGLPSEGFMATEDYMVVKILLASRGSGGSIHVVLDNFSVREFHPGLAADITGDSSIDLLDMAVMAGEWSGCARVPADQCTVSW